MDTTAKNYLELFVASKNKKKNTMIKYAGYLVGIGKKPESWGDMMNPAERQRDDIKAYIEQLQGSNLPDNWLALRDSLVALCELQARCFQDIDMAGAPKTDDDKQRYKQTMREFAEADKAFEANYAEFKKENGL
jgi:hypothetical protein